MYKALLSEWQELVAPVLELHIAKPVRDSPLRLRRISPGSNMSLGFKAQVCEAERNAANDNEIASPDDGLLSIHTSVKLVYNNSQYFIGLLTNMQASFHIEEIGFYWMPPLQNMENYISIR